MPRTLPWIANTTRASTSSPRTSTSFQRRTPSGTPSDLVDPNLDPLTPLPQTSNPPSFTSAPRDTVDGSGIGGPPRTPSSSPPPQFLSTPPPIEFMLPGHPSSDDRWIMVEDEFNDTAKLFTSHIHRAEYERVRRLARSRPAEVLKGLGRGTDGVTERTPNLKRKMERDDREKRRGGEEGGEEGRDEEEEGRDEYLEDPMLAGLMMSTKKEGNDLRGLASKARTRAAAGYTQSPNKGDGGQRDAIAEERERVEKRSEKRVERGKVVEKKARLGLENEEEVETEIDMDVGLDEVEEEGKDDDDLDIRPKQVGKTSGHVKTKNGFDADTAHIRREPKKETMKFSDRLIKARSGDASPRPTIPKGLGNSLFSSSKLPAQPPRKPSPPPKLIDLSPNKPGRGSHAAATIARHKATRAERGREEQRKARLVDEIPTFII